MNRLTTEKRAQMLSMLVEGNSVRATSRMAGVAINTVQKLLLDVGEACAAYQDEHLRDLDCKTIEADEIWSFVYSQAKERARGACRATFGYGDVWTWTAIDADTKLIASWYVGGRTTRGRRGVPGRSPQPLAQPHPAHNRRPPCLLESSVGPRVPGRYRLRAAREDLRHRARRRGALQPRRLHWREAAPCSKGNPDPDRISTSYVERQNLTMRMGMRRFTRLTNGFSKKLDNHMAAIALHFMPLQLRPPAQTLANPYPRTPAMAAGVTDHVWTLTEIAALLD